MLGMTVMMVVVVVVVIVIVIVTMMPVIMVVMPVLQQPGTHQIHHQAQGSNAHGLFILNEI